MDREVNCGDRLLRSLQVLHLCIEECTRGSMWNRNPYLRSSKTKSNLLALHKSIEQVIIDIVAFNAYYASVSNDTLQVHHFYKTYAFLFDFNDGIKREEYDHRILIKDSATLLQFSTLRYQSEQMVCRMMKDCEA